MAEASLVPYEDVKRMAHSVVAGGLFPGIKTPEQAITLFLVAQAEGLHPMTALMRYNIIQNRPAMKAEAMLASFMDRGGTVDWTEYTDEAVTGVFTSHGCPKGVPVRWTMADAKRAGVTMNQTWTKYPRQMLKARVASDGVRMADPAVNQGRYTPEEVSDFEPVPKVVPAEIVAQEPPQEAEGPSLLETQLRKSLGEEPEPPWYEGGTRDKIISAVDTVAPGHCTLKGCQGEVELYVSTSKQFLGREYWQCASAHEEKVRLLNEGATNKLANAAVAAHYREWCGPWVEMVTRENRPKIEIERPPGGSTKVVAAKICKTDSEGYMDIEPPSIFDPEAISKDVARKLAAEAK